MISSWFLIPQHNFLFAVFSGQAKGELENEDDKLSQSGSELNSKSSNVQFLQLTFCRHCRTICIKERDNNFFVNSVVVFMCTLRPQVPLQLNLPVQFTCLMG